MSFLEKRTQIRFRVHEPVIVSRVPTGREMEGRVVDISLDGVGVTIPLPLCAGDLIEVKLRSLSIIAEVRHCRPEQDGYLAGIRFPYPLQTMEVDSIRPNWRTPQ